MKLLGFRYHCKGCVWKRSDCSRGTFVRVASFMGGNANCFQRRCFCSTHTATAASAGAEGRGRSCSGKENTESQMLLLKIPPCRLGHVQHQPTLAEMCGRARRGHSRSALPARTLIWASGSRAAPGAGLRRLPALLRPSPQDTAAVRAAPGQPQQRTAHTNSDPVQTRRCQPLLKQRGRRVGRDLPSSPSPPQRL